MERETLKSRLGFILLSAGCAIGIGNVWKFPYMAGQGGGGAFVLFYLLFLVILGLPIMTMEFAVGRASRKSPVRAYQALEKPGQKWHIHGYFTLIASAVAVFILGGILPLPSHRAGADETAAPVGLPAAGVAGAALAGAVPAPSAGHFRSDDSGVFPPAAALSREVEKSAKEH